MSGREMPMIELITDCGLAVWLGILTSISPCPLTTNIAAISYVGRRVGKTKMVLFSGLLYTAGRAIAYVLIGILVINGILSIPGASNFLQRYMNLLLGPLCIVVGTLLLGVVKIPSTGSGAGPRLRRHADVMGIWGAGLLGFIFAISFCPTSAGLFFGALVPVALSAGSTVAIPALYGIGTAIPVIAFAVILAFSASAVGKIFNALKTIDIWARRITGVLFLLVGGYLITLHYFNLSPGF
jgi:cytochrome c-type biogenesis protein